MYTEWLLGQWLSACISNTFDVGFFYALRRRFRIIYKPFSKLYTHFPRLKQTFNA